MYMGKLIQLVLCCLLQIAWIIFVSLEELAESELYICPNCKKRQKSTKKFWLKRLPNVRKQI